jgi:hypothetical protein
MVLRMGANAMYFASNPCRSIFSWCRLQSRLQSNGDLHTIACRNTPVSITFHSHYQVLRAAQDGMPFLFMLSLLMLTTWLSYLHSRVYPHTSTPRCHAKQERPSLRITASKINHQRNCQSCSSKASLRFPVGRIHCLLKKGNYAQRVGAGTSGMPGQSWSSLTSC